MQKLIYLFVLIILVGGCATPRHNFSNIMLDSTPFIQEVKDPEADFKSYKTFAVFSLANTEIGKNIDSILEKQLLYVIANNLEFKGYKYVEKAKEADLNVIVFFNQEYKTYYVPPNAITLPIFVPGWTQNANINFSGYASGLGNFWGSATASTYNPGYMTYQTFVTPGYTVGHFYPINSVSFFDNKKKSRVWSGVGVTYSNNADIRLSSQVLLLGILDKFPNGDWDKDYPEWYRLGFNFLIMTNDGNNFYPSVRTLSKNSSAQVAGLKKYDIITHIDGQEVVNRRVSQIREIIKNIKSETVKLTIKRLDKIFNAELHVFPNK